MKYSKRAVLCTLATVLLLGTAMTGCQSKKSVSEVDTSASIEKILEYIDEDQLAGNHLMIEQVLQLEECGVSEEDASQKAEELMAFLFERCKVTVVDAFGLGPDDNQLLVLDDSNILWSVTYENTGKDLSFVDIKEADQSDYEYMGLYNQIEERFGSDDETEESETADTEETDVESDVNESESDSE